MYTELCNEWGNNTDRESVETTFQMSRGTAALLSPDTPFPIGYSADDEAYVGIDLRSLNQR